MAAIFAVALAIVASVLVLLPGVTYTLVLGPTFIVALLVIMYMARYERRMTGL